MILLIFTTCEKFEKLAVVKTGTTSNLESTSVKISGTVVDPGDGILEHGHCLSESVSNPKIDNCDSKTNLGKASSPGDFFSEITGLNPGTNYYVTAYATSSMGTIYGKTINFSTTSLSTPIVSTLAASNITETTVTLNGTVNANGLSTTVTFEYGLTTSYGQVITAVQSPVSGASNTNVSSNIAGLSANTPYHFRVVGTSTEGRSEGNDQTFTTNSLSSPTVTTIAANNITETSATLNGTVNANGLSTTVTFEYGLTTSYGQSILAVQSPVSGTSTTNVSTNIPGLTANTLYHFRVVGTSTGGTTEGDDLSFTTSAYPPVVTTNAANNITEITATLNGTVNANGLSTTVTFEYGLTTSYGQSITAVQSPVSGTSNTNVSANISGLAGNTLYHFRVVGMSTAGTSNGSDLTFTTLSSCSNFQITHNAGEVAPVAKTVTYNVVETDLSGETKCWLTQNLGADNQATSATDISTTAAGWKWQFNRKQGYYYTEPISPWTTTIDENSNWTLANDPCNLLLGSGWRIPTITELSNADINGAWDNYNETFSSVLKLHTAGEIRDGTLYSTNAGYYWSNTQVSNTNGLNLYFNSSESTVGGTGVSKSYGLSLRCIKD